MFTDFFREESDKIILNSDDKIIAPHTERIQVLKPSILLTHYYDDTR